MEGDTFTALMQQEWQQQFADDGANDWRGKWFADGLRADIRNTPDGMVFAAGPLIHGRVGIRHMWTRCSRYANIRIATRQ